MIRFESSSIRRDKAGILIAINASFIHNSQNNNDDDNDMFYTLEILKK